MSSSCLVCRLLALCLSVGIRFNVVSLLQTFMNAALNHDLGAMSRTRNNRPLSDLFFNREWDTIRAERLLYNNPCNKTDRKILVFEGEDGTTLLHVMCRFQPPVDMVRSAVEELNWMVDVKEPSTGHFPLHVACMYGSRSDVVKFFLEKIPEAAMTADVNGRMPVHLACRPIRWLPDDIPNHGSPRRPTYIQAGSAVIQALCSNSPKATNVDDCDGCNPLEIAIEHGLSNKICQILLDSSDVGWKEREAEKEKERSFRSEDISVDGTEFSLPGYTPSAAREHLKRLRSNREMGREQGAVKLATDTTMSLRNMQTRESDDTSITTAGSLAHLSSSLPPYEEMLQMYQTMNASFRSSASSRNGSVGVGVNRYKDDGGAQQTSTASAQRQNQQNIKKGQEASKRVISTTPAAYIAGGDDIDNKSSSSSSISSFFSDSSSDDSSNDSASTNESSVEADRRDGLSKCNSQSARSLSTDASECRTIDGSIPKNKQRDSSLLEGFARACKRRVPHSEVSKDTSLLYGQKEGRSSASDAGSVASAASSQLPPAGIRGHISRGLVRMGSTLRDRVSHRDRESTYEQNHIPKSITIFPESLLGGRGKDVEEGPS